MSQVDVIRAWKDEDYRLSLSAEQLALLPENPAGIVELSDSDLADDVEDPITISIISVTLPICPTLWLCSITVWRVPTLLQMGTQEAT